MGILSPKKPVRADHRLIKKLLDVMLEGKVEHIPSELTDVSRVFLDYGGSWGGLFQGSVEDITKLKKVITHAYEEGYLTKREDWI